MTEKDVAIAAVTETWLGGENKLDPDELREVWGLGLMTRNREAAVNGVHYGGVAILWRTSLCTMREVCHANPEGYEVMVGTATLPGHSRRLVVVACYLPPNYDRLRGVRLLNI